MSLFNPETIFRSLVASLGVSPQQVQEALALLFSELRTLQAERAAFKAGASVMVAHFNDRLDRLETRFDHIEGLLLQLAEERSPAAPRRQLETVN